LNTVDLKPYWAEERDWLCTLQFLPTSDPAQRALDTEDLGYLLGYAQLTDTRVLALLGDPSADAYEILFSFSSAELKERFLDLIRSNEDMGELYIRDELLIPTASEIQHARPLSTVLPPDVVQEAAVVATTLLAGVRHDRAAS
jgi:hypothetical protein